MSPEERRRILEQLFFFGPGVFRSYLFRYLTLLFLSVAIAAFGLYANQGTVVIGAMLVAPLMTPLLATAAAVMMGWYTRLGKTLVLLGTTSLRSGLLRQSGKSRFGGLKWPNLSQKAISAINFSETQLRGR